MPEPTVAARSFAAALRVLQAAPLDPLDRGLPLTYGSTTPGPPAPPTGRPATRPGVGPLSEAIQAQRRGATSSVELVERALRAIEDHNATLSAMVEVQPAKALAEAARADDDRAAGRWRGPLHGIPVSVKDIIDVAGYTTRAGSLAYERRAEHAAAAVSLLRRAGAVIIGKASTHEFALGVTTPQSRNPFDPERIPGGSSGGSAISVATGMALASLGTDTRASIRVPAALSGVVGLKATHGRIPISGIVSLSWTMDHVAPMAATVADAGLMLEALLGGCRVDLDAPLPAGLRVGVPEAALLGADVGVVEAVEAAVASLVAAAQGRSCPLAVPGIEDLELASAAGLIVSRCEAAAAHRSLGLDRSKYWDEVAEQLHAADSVRAVDYLDAQRQRGQLAERLLGCFDEADLLAMPTALTVAPLASDYERHLMTLARNAIPWSLVGFPAISVPAGLVSGLPVGLQLVAPPHREDLLLAAARAVEEEVGLLTPMALGA